VLLLAGSLVTIELVFKIFEK